MSVTPEMITPQKKELPDTRKEPKIDLGGTYSDHRESDSHTKQYDSQHRGYDSTVSDECDKNTVTEHI